MRLLRALAHLALAFALVSATAAQARAMVCAPAAAPSRHHDHAAGAERAAHDQAGPAHEHAGPAHEHPPHGRDGCRTICCFIAAQPAAPAAEASAVAFCAVRYVVGMPPASGRAFAPDPGVPKPLA